MTPPPPPVPESSGAVPDPGPELFGPLLARLRSARGWSQPHLAARLCAAAGVPTVTRHEVSRWERQARLPGAFWLDWLALVLAVPRQRLVAAAEASRRVHRAPMPAGSRSRRRPSGPRPRSGRRRPAGRRTQEDQPVTEGGRRGAPAGLPACRTPGGARPAGATG